MTDASSDSRKARDERKQAHLRAIFERYVERFRASAVTDAPSLAREAHAEIDGLLERDRRRDAASAGIRCGKGCDHCCRGPVEIWPHEAELLVEAALAAGVALERPRLERQGRHDIETWQDQPAADRACVFLGAEGACKVYESRPNACRKLLVTSDPVLCDASRRPADAPARWFSWESELMEAAALDVFGRELMPRALLAAMGKGR